ncbi:MAG: FmdB family zinc ribbon protein [Candidatus Acidiferrum sp.]
MRRARSVMSSRLPIGVPTRYKHPKADSVLDIVAPPMTLSLARTAETFCYACYTFLFGDGAEGAAVPLYEYKCLKCGRHTEKIETVAGPHLKKCPHCGGKVESVITAPAIKFKGSGWYVTDYAGKSPDGGSKESKPAGDSKEGGSKPGDAKDGGGAEAAGKDAGSKETASKESSSKEKKPAKKK